MGSSQSVPSPEKPAQTSDNVFKNIHTPIIFTNNLISHLDSNKESDSTRSATLEAHIQSRVQAELARLEARSESVQNEVDEQLKKQGLLTERESTNLSSVTLEGDIKELRDKYVRIKDAKEDAEARKARAELVRCLQSHDRQSLDCWWEVKQFRDKVAQLEKEFVCKNQ